MINKLANLLVKTKLLDPDYTVSTTSILMFVIIVKIALLPTLDLPTITALFVTLMHANAKRFNSFMTKQSDQTKAAELEAVRAQLAAQEAKDREAVETLSKEVQSLKQNQNLSKLGM